MFSFASFSLLKEKKYFFIFAEMFHISAVFLAPTKCEAFCGCLLEGNLGNGKYKYLIIKYFWSFL